MKAKSVVAIMIGLVIGRGAVTLWASGPAGCYALLEKVVLEPNDMAPERIQVCQACSPFDNRVRHPSRRGAATSLGLFAPLRAAVFPFV